MKDKLHTADHILCTILEGYRATTKSMEFKADSARITFVSKKDLRKVKEKLQHEVNEVVKKNLEVVNYKLARKEAEKITDISMVPKSVKEITIYEIKGFNKVACGGPHVKKTNEIGNFDITEIKKKGKDTYSIKYSVRKRKIKTEKEQGHKMKLQTAKGVKDVPPEEKIIKNKVVATLREVFELYGFSPLETPIMEKYETLTAKFAAGEASDALRETFKLKDQGKRELGLRFDLTVPLSRFVAMNPTLKLPFKRYEVGRVFRDGPIKLGRYREFWQMDIDTVGTKSMLADAEIVAMVDTVFKKLKFDVIIKINNRKLLNGILNQAGIKKREEAIIAIDKLDKIGVKGVTEELLERGYKKAQIKKVFEFVKEGISLAQLRNKITDEEGKEGLTELEEVFDYVKQMGVSRAVFDVSLARGLAYYTGTIFEAFLKKGPITSSLAGGGRYDKMIGNFIGGSREIPAMGISFGLAPIMDVLKLKEKNKAKTTAKVYVLPINTIKESLKITQQLRNGGINTDFALGKKGVSKNLQYANALGIPYVVIIGEDELKKGKVLLRNMEDGSEKMLTVKSVIQQLE